MGSNTRPNRAIGQKFGGMLSGLLSGLYDFSSVDANPDNPAGGNTPFKSGGGLFGGLKAKGANAQVAGQNALAEATSIRRLRDLPKELAFENEAAINLLGKQNELERGVQLRAKGDASMGLGSALAELPAEQLALMKTPATFSSPEQQVDWYNQAFGAQTPVIKAPVLAQELANQFAIQSDPRVLSAGKSKAIGEGLYKAGDSNINLDTNVDIQGASSSTQEELIPIFEDSFDPISGEMKQVIKGYKTVRTPVFKQGSINNLKDNRVSQQEADAALNEEATNTSTNNVGPIQTNQPWEQPSFNSGLAPIVSSGKGNTQTLTTQQQELPDNFIGPKLPNRIGLAHDVANFVSENIPSIEPLKTKYSEAGTAFKRVGTGVGNLLSDIRKYVSRKPSESFSPPNSWDLLRTSDYPPQSDPNLSSAPLRIPIPIPVNNYIKPNNTQLLPTDFSQLSPFDVQQPDAKYNVAPVAEAPQLTEEELMQWIDKNNKRLMWKGKYPTFTRQPIRQQSMEEFNKTRPKVKSR